MKREEILSIFRRVKILDIIKDGPVAILASSGAKRISIVIAQKGNTISASVGRFFKRRFTFHPDELQ